jgi:hypothetical protein
MLVSGSQSPREPKALGNGWAVRVEKEAETVARSAYEINATQGTWEKVSAR